MTANCGLTFEIIVYGTQCVTLNREYYGNRIQRSAIGVTFVLQELLTVAQYLYQHTV